MDVLIGLSLVIYVIVNSYLNEKESELLEKEKEDSLRKENIDDLYSSNLNKKENED